jgi:hypothetical protein
MNRGAVAGVAADVRSGSIASVRVCWPYIRSYPDSDRNRDLRARRLSATLKPEHVQKLREQSDVYSITSSAVASSVCGIVNPSALAVLRLTASSNFVGCSTGKSAGLTPFRILSK